MSFGLFISFCIYLKKLAHNMQVVYGVVYANVCYSTIDLFYFNILCSQSCVSDTCELSVHLRVTQMLHGYCEFI